MTRQRVSNACWDQAHLDCGLHAPDGRPCECSCHELSADDAAVVGGELVTCDGCELAFDAWQVRTCVRCNASVCLGCRHDINDMRSVLDDPVWLCRRCFDVISRWAW